MYVNYKILRGIQQAENGWGKLISEILGKVRPGNISYVHMCLYSPNSLTISSHNHLTVPISAYSIIVIVTVHFKVLTYVCILYIGMCAYIHMYNMYASVTVSDFSVLSF